jgi:hypothetical protein
MSTATSISSGSWKSSQPADTPVDVTADPEVPPAHTTADTGNIKGAKIVSIIVL